MSVWRAVDETNQGCWVECRLGATPPPLPSGRRSLQPDRSSASHPVGPQRKGVEDSSCVNIQLGHGALRSFLSDQCWERERNSRPAHPVHSLIVVLGTNCCLLHPRRWCIAWRMLRGFLCSHLHMLGQSQHVAVVWVGKAHACLLSCPTPPTLLHMLSACRVMCIGGWGIQE